MRLNSLRVGGWGLGTCAQSPGSRALSRLLAAALSVALAGCFAAHAFAGTVNRILAIVNEEVITEADMALHISAFLESEQSPPSVHPDSAEVRQMVLRRLIEQRLILQEAKREGIVVGPDEIAGRLDALRERFRSDEEFQRSLSDSNLSQQQLKEQIRDQLMVQRVIDVKVRSTIVVSPQEVAGELSSHPQLAKPGDRVRVSHILLRVNEARSEESARALIEEIHGRLMAGEDFSSLAKRYSEDPHGEEGGAMGWVAPGELLPELDTALFTLNEGELSSPIRTRLGFHLVKVDERRTASSLSMMEAHRAVSQRLYQQKFQEAFKRWLAELTSHAYIEVVSPEGRSRL